MFQTEKILTCDSEYQYFSKNTKGYFVFLLFFKGKPINTEICVYV